MCICLIPCNSEGASRPEPALWAIRKVVQLWEVYGAGLLDGRVRSGPIDERRRVVIVRSGDIATDATPVVAALVLFGLALDAGGMCHTGI